MVSQTPLPTSNLHIQVLAGSLAVGVSALVAVLLRIKARRLRKVALAMDDYSMIIALVLSWGVVVGNIIATRYGLGKHVVNLTPIELIMFFKVFFASQIIWAVAIPVIKFSILMQYLRIFGILTYIKLCAWTLIVLSAAWGIMVVAVLFLKCQPLDFNWDISIKGRCIDEILFYKIGTGINVSSDVLILFLPMPAIWSLNVQLRQRVRIVVVFVVASLSCAFSTARLISLFKLRGNDITYELAIPCTWSALEPCLGIVAACLATTGPIIEAVKVKFQNSLSQPSTTVPRSERSLTLNLRRYAQRLGSTENIALESISSPVDKDTQTI